MSRGLGSIQRSCLAFLESNKGVLLDSIEITIAVIGRDEVTSSEHASVRRALRKLAAAGVIVDRGRGWPDKRRRWELPQECEPSQEGKRRHKLSDLGFRASSVWETIENSILEVLQRQWVQEQGRWLSALSIIRFGVFAPEFTERPKVMGLGETCAIRYQLRRMIRRGIVESRIGSKGGREYRLAKT